MVRGKRRNPMVEKQVDDLPSSALKTMKATLDLMEDVFPRVRREDMAKVFVGAYFRAEEDGRG